MDGYSTALDPSSQGTHRGNDLCSSPPKACLGSPAQPDGDGSYGMKSCLPERAKAGHTAQDRAPPSHGPWTLRCLGAGTTCCSLALLLITILSPRWLLIDSPDDGYHSGVWWLCSRPVCAGIITETASFKAIRALLLFALLASSVAVASLLVSIRPFARWRGSRFLVSATANFIAGILSLFVHSSLPVLSPRVGPQSQPSQDLEEMPAPGGLEGGPGAEPLPLGQLNGTSPYRAVSSCSACLSFLLLSAALLGPGWRDGGHPQDAGVLAGLCTKLACGSTRQTSDLLRAARICLTLGTLAGFVAAVAVLSRCSRLARVGKAPGLLISAAASFTAGLSGLTAMVLYTLAEAGPVAPLNITWPFCLAWLVCTLSIVNGPVAKTLPGGLARGEMLACSVGSCLLAVFSLVLLCMALFTDYWLVALGPHSTSHSGLWQECLANECQSPPHVTGYIQATRAFLILAALATAASVLSLLLSLTSCVRIPVSTDLLASIAAFTAGSCTLIAMAVYTGESWHKNQDGQIQLTFEWSFHLGWAALPLLALSGAFSLVAHQRHAGYERQ
ncbi:S-acyl fatty acid synthase thioesterase, medium chain [Platysternon megacephalum]|uniref:S-acyl fatty acid synthase thioesterase, medium chain n=1 Tax=Platysternon megacephalum TaxID=55544 RepID=A0A4D9DIP6_9SAUR|nr:S-acyl fatty acid synthase thioesterase, medium chain [Platysternon megacephalum]